LYRLQGDPAADAVDVLRRVVGQSTGDHDAIDANNRDDIAARIRGAITLGRPNDVMYHVGRPGEDGFTERVLAAWGVDGHNSHTNICSSGGRAGYQYWMGFDRPSPDFASADVMAID